MTDRDLFAAAALTGLLANEGDGPSLSSTCAYSYRIADAMLRERTKNNAGPIVPSRDTAGGGSPPVAAPAGESRHAASQSPDAQCGGGQPLDEPRPDTNGKATGGRGHNTQEPAAWLAGRDQFFQGYRTKEKAERAALEAHMGIGCQEWDVFPVYRHPQPSLTDEEREALIVATHELNALHCFETNHSATLRNLLARLS